MTNSDICMPISLLAITLNTRYKSTHSARSRKYIRPWLCTSWKSSGVNCCRGTAVCMPCCLMTCMLQRHYCTVTLRFELSISSMTNRAANDVANAIRLYADRRSRLRSTVPARQVPRGKSAISAAISVQHRLHAMLFKSKRMHKSSAMWSRICVIVR